jgi:RHS repeat-associated protein
MTAAAWETATSARNPISAATPTASTAAGPHAVTSINTGATGGCTLSSCSFDGVSNPNVYYDADGNMLCVTTRNQCDGTAARSYSYTSFNMAESVTTGANTTTLGYTPEHARGSLTTSAATLYYFSNPAAGVANELIAGVTPTWRTYLTTEGRIVAEFFNTGGAMTQYYFTADHLTSTTALTDASGAGKEYDSYDAWGKRRNANGNDLGGCLSTRPSSVTLRGYTGQEEMDSYCLVNLNARLYDPALGRLTSADPTIPDALNGQAFNRYSYVLNNPPAFTDPSGYVSVYGERVHIICVDGCSLNSNDTSESMVDYGTGLLNSGLYSFSETDHSTDGTSTTECCYYEYIAPFTNGTNGAGSGWFYTGLGGSSAPLGANESNGGNFAGWARNLRNFITSPGGYALTGQLQYWGNALKYAAGGTQLIGSGVMVGGALTGQIEVIPVGAMGVAFGDALDIGADALLGSASFMESVQQGNSSPILDFAINGYIDSSEPTVGDFYQPPGGGK